MADNTLVTIDWNLLGNVSYRSNLGKNLKNTLRKFDKEELFSELDVMISYFTEVATEERIPQDNRIKSIQSCEIKYQRYYPTGQVEKVFNDVLGLRVVIDDYKVFDNLVLPENTRIADMRNGKSHDDGYRGIHVYYQKDHFYYPIEVQFVTSRDRQFNEWLHIYVYKYVADSSIGCRLREKYETGLITNEDEFRKEMEDVLSDSEKI